MNQREAFEAWWERRYSNHSLAPYVSNTGVRDFESYSDTRTQMAWQAWQAALASQWQPIETAPKDGTVILASLPGSDVPHSVRWHDMKRGWCLSWDGWRLGEYSQPTHWQPLPPEPAK